MNIPISERIIAVLSYFTFGFFSLIWIIFANVAKKPISRFLAFNLYQAIFISIALAIVSLVYSIALNFLSAIPFLNTLARNFNLFFNETPMYFGFTLSGLLVSILLLYLSILALFGKKSYLPVISDIVSVNFGV